MFGKTILLQPIQGKSLKLDVPERDDLIQFKPWMNDPEVARYLAQYRGYTVEDELGWFDNTAKQVDKVAWAIYHDGQIIGNCGLFHIDHQSQHAEYGVVIGQQSAWGQGVGTAILEAVSQYGFKQLNLRNIYLNVFMPNQGSLKSAQKAGYKHFGTHPEYAYIDGQFVDMWMGQRQNPALLDR